MVLPVQNILADVVQVCEGSRVLLRILSHLGCTSSPDTYDRFVTSQALVQRERSIWNALSKHTFTVISADNFDILQTHAAVYCGNQSRSYHATTIQVVQPSVNLKVNCLHDTTLPLSPIPINRRPHSDSPFSSPHHLGKDGPKLKRTLSPHKLNTDGISLQSQSTSNPHLTLHIQNFKMNEVDGSVMTSLLNMNIRLEEWT